MDPNPPSGVTPPADARPLSPKEERFVIEYCIDLDGAKAARRAGYKDGPGIYHTAYRLLRKNQIKTAIEQRRRKVVSKRLMAADEVLEEWSRLATSDIGDLYDEHGNMIPLHLLPADVRRAIASTKTVIRNVSGGDGHTDTVVEIKLWPKPDALQFLGRFHGQDVQKIQVSGDLFAKLDEGRRRVAAAKQKPHQPAGETSR